MSGWEWCSRLPHRWNFEWTVLVAISSPDSRNGFGVGDRHRHQRLVGAVATRWETDLPVVTPDGRLALLGGKDVSFVDPEKLDS